jgi:hypothetical protein
MSACSITGDNLTDPSFQTLRYAGGVGEGSEFKGCVDGGEKMVGDDTYYPYPATQREAVWDSNSFNKGNNSADYPDLEVTDRDGRKVYVKMKVSFYLNTSCEPVTVNGKRYDGGVLQVFHENVGKTRHAYFNEDGTYGNGWLWAMDNYIATPVVDFVGREARQEQAENMYSTTDIQDEIQKQLAENMPALVNAGMEGDLQFYDHFTVKIYKMTPEDAYLNLLKEREDAQIKAETADLNASARVKEAEANAKVKKAEAEIMRNEIAGYGGFENWNKAKAVENGLNPYQPTIVAPGIR